MKKIDWEKVWKDFYEHPNYMYLYPETKTTIQSLVEAQLKRKKR